MFWFNVYSEKLYNKNLDFFTTTTRDVMIFETLLK